MRGVPSVSAERRRLSSLPYFPIRAIVFGSVSSRKASRPIQRAVRSCDEASVRLSPTASPCSRRLRLPICLRAQLTAFLTKLRGSSAAFPISPSSGRNLSSGDREGRAPDVFLLARSVSLDQLVGERGAAQQVLTAQVADVPCVELLRPAVGEFDGRLPGIGNHRGQQAGLVPARVPERDGQRMVRARLPGDLSQRGNRNAQCPLRRNAETAHAAAALGQGCRSEDGYQVVCSVHRSRFCPARAALPLSCLPAGDAIPGKARPVRPAAAASGKARTCRKCEGMLPARPFALSLSANVAKKR